MQQNDKTTGVLFYLLLLTAFFILLELSFFIQSNSVYFSIFSALVDNLHIPITVLPGMLYFIFAQLLVHFSYCLLVWFISLQITKLLHLSADRALYLAISIWTLGIVTILVANQ
jgi:hypothetical protein